MRLLLKLTILKAKIARDKICKLFSMRKMMNHRIYSKTTMKTSISKTWGSKWYFNKILSLMLISMISKKMMKMMRRISKKFSILSIAMIKKIWKR